MYTPVYVVSAYYNGYYNQHSYVFATTMDIEKAYYFADLHRDDRAGKVAVLVQRIEPNLPMPVAGWPVIHYVPSWRGESQLEEEL